MTVIIAIATATSISTISHLAKPSLSVSSKDKISKLLSSCLHSVASSICGTVSTLLFVYLQAQCQGQMRLVDRDCCAHSWLAASMMPYCALKAASAPAQSW